MARRTDTTARLSETRICEINGVTQQYRRTLVKRGLVRAAPASGCTVRDALELAAIRRLSHALGSSDTNLAASQLGEVLADSIPAGRLDLVYDRQYKRLSAARDDGQLRALVAHGRAVTVLPLAECLAEVADAFRRIVELGGSSERAAAGARGRKRPSRARPMSGASPGDADV